MRCLIESEKPRLRSGFAAMMSGRACPSESAIHKIRARLSLAPNSFFTFAESHRLSAHHDGEAERFMSKEIVRNFHNDALASFRNYKKLAERAIEQISDEEFFKTIDAEANSIAVIVKHIAGNLHSRWRDFLTTDGEKPDRNRDAEFEMVGDTRESLMAFWESGWQTLFDNIEPLTESDFSKTVAIRGEPHTIVEAINRQLTHYAYHVGQIALLAKHFKSAEWKSLSVPKNRSAEFNQFLADQQKSGIDNVGRFSTREVIEQMDDKKGETG